MAVVAGRVPDVIHARVEAIKFGMPMDIVDGEHVIFYGDEAKASLIISQCDGVITSRKNMVRRRGA